MKIFYCPILAFFALFVFVCSKTEAYAQQVVDFSYERTRPNHSVLALPIWHPVIKKIQQSDSIPSDVVLGFQNDSLQAGDLVGVFFMDNNGDYKCAGSLKWKVNDFNMLPVWGADPADADNGMEIGEKMVWLAQKKDNRIYHIEPSYQEPLMSIYLKDGMSAVLGMSLKVSEVLKPNKLFDN